MKTILILLLLVNCLYAYANFLSFMDYMILYNKTYKSSELINRYNIYIENTNTIQYLNSVSKYSVYKSNKFSDLSYDEFKRLSGALEPEPKYVTKSTITNIDYTNISDSIDWRERGYVTRIKNQGTCGVCYIFSAISNFETQFAIKYSKLYTFSEQEVLDCYSGATCDGGYISDVFNFLSIDGSCYLTDYSNTYGGLPYYGYKRDCKDKKCVKIAKTEGYDNGNGELFILSLLQKGSASVYINSDLLRSYSSGIISEPCNTSVDHAVVIVGYGTYNYTGKNIKYWIARNSWGDDWGENGYFRIIRGENECGIEKYALQSKVVKLSDLTPSKSIFMILTITLACLSFVLILVLLILCIKKYRSNN